MSPNRSGLIGLGVGVGFAGAAAAAGLVADRVHRRRADALETGVSLVETPSRQLFVAATDGVPLHVEIDEPATHDGEPTVDENGLVRPTVILSHGYCLTSECWVFQRRYLRWAGYRVVVWDQRGHGRSGRGDPDSYTIAQLGVRREDRPEDLRPGLEKAGHARPQPFQQEPPGRGGEVTGGQRHTPRRGRDAPEGDDAVADEVGVEGS